jgi:hypothetical protein
MSRLSKDSTLGFFYEGALPEWGGVRLSLVLALEWYKVLNFLGAVFILYVYQAFIAAKTSALSPNLFFAPFASSV